MQIKKRHTAYSRGQTLIETVVGLFILTTGLASGLALAVFSFGASSDIGEQIVATGLAREGIEVVRRMRDSNWLADTLVNCESGEFCYEDWLTETYDITGSAGNGSVYRSFFDPQSLTNKWTLDASNPADDYRLYLQAGGGLSHTVTGSPTNFFRKITIMYEDTSSPYSMTSPLVLVRSSVWWHGKNCPEISYLNNPGDTTCKLITEENLTNWKNY